MKNREGQVGAVAEIQGLYGPFSFPEKLLQQIWLRGDFDGARASTADGRPVRILHPGKWNLLGGPDFKDARLTIGGAPVTGDIEVHLRASDWEAHGHAQDPAHARVVLHVILFPVAEGQVTKGADGREIPTLALLPLLHHDLEEYAADDAVERLAGRPLARAQRELAAFSFEALRAELHRGAESRWRQKVHFAKLRIGRLGWTDACHHTALEILGYRFNRAPMLAIAGALPLAAWTPAGEGAVARALEQGQGRWSMQGVRPANHPRKRLQQYARWVAERADWPARLEALGGKLPACPLSSAPAVGEVRKKHKFPALRETLSVEICAGAVGGTRFDTLICDGFLPLLAARQAGDDALIGLWFAWFAGDNPDKFARILRELGAVRSPASPLCHGLAQGLLGWMLATEQSSSVDARQTPGAGLDNISDGKLF